VTRRGAGGCLSLAAFLLTTPAQADTADVLDAIAACDAQRICRFAVTVRHPDSGWDHYADAWEVLAPDGTVLARRTLLHPHVTEQPFTRSLEGVHLPEGLDHVSVRAHDSRHGWGGATVRITLEPVAR
jgi:hypothetical protein